MYNPYLRFMGKNIRYCRKRMGLSIDAFAKEIGLAPGFLGLIERGIRGTSIENLVKIADYFNITLEEMIKVDLSTGRSFVKKELDRPRKKLLKTINKMNDAEISLFALLAKDLNKFEIEKTIEIGDTEEFGVIYKNSIISPDFPVT